MQRAIGREPFDRSDISAFLHHGERETGIDTSSVHQHRARATLTVVTTLFRACQVETIPQDIQEGSPGCNFNCDLGPVDNHTYGNFSGYRDRIAVSWCRIWLSHLNLRTSRTVTKCILRSSKDRCVLLKHCAAFLRLVGLVMKYRGSRYATTRFGPKRSNLSCFWLGTRCR